MGQRNSNCQSKTEESDRALPTYRTDILLLTLKSRLTLGKLSPPQLWSKIFQFSQWYDTTNPRRRRLGDGLSVDETTLRQSKTKTHTDIGARSVPFTSIIKLFTQWTQSTCKRKRYSTKAFDYHEKIRLTIMKSLMLTCKQERKTCLLVIVRSMYKWWLLSTNTHTKRSIEMHRWRVDISMSSITSTDWQESNWPT